MDPNQLGHLVSRRSSEDEHNCTDTVNLVWSVMILGFADRATEDLYHGDNTRESRKIPQQVWNSAVRKLDLLNAAKDLGDLSQPPGNHLEALKGNLQGLHSIRVNDQFRLVFEWKDSGVDRVQITDYH